MDPIKTIGQFLGSDAVRDAIHIAVLPVIAGEDLRTGDRITLAHGTSDVAIRALDEYGVMKSIGIADPFLKEWSIPKNTRFWMFLHPNTITGIRHQWEHPRVDRPADVSNDSEKWLHAFAERWGFDYDDLITAATTETSGHYDRYVTAYGHDLHSASELGDDHDLFWQHLAVITGRVFDVSHREGMGWSCSC